jgi:hypothetical protein
MMKVAIESGIETEMSASGNSTMEKLIIFIDKIFINCFWSDGHGVFDCGRNILPLCNSFRLFI